MSVVVYKYVNMLVMGFVLGQSLMVIPIECYPYVKKYLPIIMYCDVFLLFTSKENCLQKFERMSPH